MLLAAHPHTLVRPYTINLSQQRLIGTTEALQRRAKKTKNSWHIPTSFKICYISVKMPTAKLQLKMIGTLIISLPE